MERNRGPWLSVPAELPSQLSVWTHYHIRDPFFKVDPPGPRRTPMISCRIKTRLPFHHIVDWWSKEYNVVLCQHIWSGLLKNRPLIINNFLTLPLKTFTMNQSKKKTHKPPQVQIIYQSLVNPSLLDLWPCPTAFPSKFTISHYFSGIEFPLCFQISPIFLPTWGICLLFSGIFFPWFVWFLLIT